MPILPRVALILTGGTIDSVGKDRLDNAWYNETGKRLQDRELLHQVPELQDIAAVPGGRSWEKMRSDVASLQEDMGHVRLDMEALPEAVATRSVIQTLLFLWFSDAIPWPTPAISLTNLSSRAILSA